MRQEQTSVFLMVPMAVLLMLVSSAPAGFIAVNSRAELAGNDLIDWSQLGPIGTVLPHAGSSYGPIAMTTDHGLGVTLRGQVFGAESDPVVDEYLGTPSLLHSLGVFGDRNNRTAGLVGWVRIDFSSPVEAIGFNLVTQSFRQRGVDDGRILVNITSASTGFTAQGLFEALPRDSRSGNPPLTTFERFLGFRSDSGPDIARIEVTLGVGTNLEDGLQMGSLEINQVDLVRSDLPPGGEIPEPSSMALLGIGLGAIGCRTGMARRRRTGCRAASPVT